MQRIWTDVTCFFSMHSGVAEQITLAGMALKALSFLKHWTTKISNELGAKGYQKQADSVYFMLILTSFGQTGS